jgi:FtsZ-interacting cell division protein ZipA
LTSFHYTLIALGIGLVVLVMLYNLYQERRSRKQAERIFQLQEAGKEVSLDNVAETETLPDLRIEPTIRLRDEDSPVSAALHDPLPDFAEEIVIRDVEPATDPVRSPATPSAEPVAPRMAPESPLDAEIEYIARLRYVQPVAVPFASVRDSLRRISKPIRMVGQRKDGEWEAISGHAATAYETVEMSILLADRTGPVSEVQLDTFCRRLYEFATEHGGAISCQDKSEAVAQANALDAFCAQVDMLIGLNVVPATGTAFESRTVHSLVTEAGLEQGVDGVYSLRDERGQTLFTLANGGENEASHGLNLLFDVPRVARGLESFDRMTELGLLMADELGGSLVDEGGRPVNRTSLTRDRQSLEGLYARMAERGIPAGGERALRLFA